MRRASNRRAALTFADGQPALLQKRFCAASIAAGICEWMVLLQGQANVLLKAIEGGKPLSEIIGGGEVQDAHALDF